MEQFGAATRLRHQRSPPSADRFLGMLQQQSNSASTPPLELSEHDIFSTPSGSSSPSPTHQYVNLNPSQTRNINRNRYGILDALNGSLMTRTGSGSRSGSDIRPVFNHKASASASLSSSSTSPATSTSSRVMIPRPPPQAQRVRFHHQSAPVNVPVMPAALQRRARELGEVVSEGEEEEEEKDKNGMIMPPHELVAARHSPMLASSVLEGAGRTLKGRDLRQVRNAIWRKTGFVD